MSKNNLKNIEGNSVKKSPINEKVVNEKVAVIIANGEFPKEQRTRQFIFDADYIVCCDGAFKTYIEELSDEASEYLRPDVVIGDLDSLEPELVEKYHDLIVHVPEQETNDQTKAFKYVLDNFPQVSKVHILAATGKREDHTLGNMSLLMEYERMFNLKDRGVEVDMISDYSRIFAVTDTVELNIGTGKAISIFSPDNSLKIKSEGLVWPTDDVVFDSWWKATLNRSSKDIVKLTLSHKSFVLIILSF